MIDFDDIVDLRGEQGNGGPRVRRRAAVTTQGLGRRSVLGGAVAAGTTLGLTALGVFGPARQALAAGYKAEAVSKYLIYTHCPSYAAGAECSPGCGPSVVCATCCTPKGFPAYGFHKNVTQKPKNTYRVRPYQCYAGRYSGWEWHHAARCGSCSHSVTWRCHDGWKKNAAGAWYKTICRFAVACS